MTQTPKSCEKCKIELHVDEKFLKDSDGTVVRLYCQNGHSIILRLKTKDDFDYSKFYPENSTDGRVNRKRQSTVTPPEQPRAKNRSLLCKICNKRIYNAGPNQKFHSGNCLIKSKRLYYAIANRKRRIKIAS
jgi:hypothetical protein